MGAPPSVGRGVARGPYEELRRRLLGPEQDDLDELRRRLDDLSPSAEDVATVLTDAVRLETDRGEGLGSALGPTVEKALKSSIRRDPQSVADAIYPVMGPAIRRYVAQAMQGMLQSFNQAVEHSVSLKGLRWRFEAWRTGRSFGEVVALHTLLYQVEQVFLIHRETGLLLAHRAVQAAKGADLVSGMLVAIRDFVIDSFGESGGSNSLETIQVGDRTVWVEPGRHAALAVVIRGRAPASLRETMSDTLQEVHARFAEPLDGFDGNDAPFAPATDVLAQCMVSRSRDLGSARSRPWLLLVLLSVLGVLLATWIGLSALEAHRWRSLVAELDAEPGIVVTGTERRSGRRIASGLHDPLARDPAAVLAASPFESDEVELAFEPYVSAEPTLALRRARALLRPPAGVDLSLRDGVLRAEGAPPADWLAWAAERAPFVPGVDRVEAEATDPSERLRALGSELARVSVSFDAGSVVVAEGPELVRLRALLSELDGLAAPLGDPLAVWVTGSADAATGGAARNRFLAERRAENVIEALGPALWPSLDLRPRTRLVPGGAEGSAGRRVVLELGAQPG